MHAYAGSWKLECRMSIVSCYASMMALVVSLHEQMAAERVFYKAPQGRCLPLESVVVAVGTP